jgi:hypothetical protein
MAVGAVCPGVTGPEVRRALAAACGFSVVLMARAATLAEAAILMDRGPPVGTRLAFPPGGQGGLAILARVAGAVAEAVAGADVGADVGSSAPPSPRA